MTLAAHRSCRSCRLMLLPLCAAVIMLSAGCSTSTRDAHAPPEDPYANVNTVAHDRALWMRLLEHHKSIRRDVTYLPTGVSATTESDDPAVAAMIREHAHAMAARMKVGADVRIWDPVFRELFNRYGEILLAVTPTPSGVTIVESASDPETVSLLWSHAAGVTEFIRTGPASASKPTPRIAPGSPPPSPESVAAVTGAAVTSEPRP